MPVFDDKRPLAKPRGSQHEHSPRDIKEPVQPTQLDGAPTKCGSRAGHCHSWLYMYRPRASASGATWCPGSRPVGDPFPMVFPRQEALLSRLLLFGKG